MELIYKIEFKSTNSYFKYIIEKIISESKANVKCKMYKGFILLLCEDTTENIEKFFKLLEVKLPLSIYLGKAEVIEEFDFEANKELEDKKIKQNLSLLTNDEIKKIIDENHIDFSNDINVLKKGKISRFETHNGLKDLFLASKEIREDFEAKNFEVKLLITNINEITNLLDVSQRDLQLLCSIERPLIKLRFKADKNLENEFSNTRFIYAKIPDDKETVLFSQALKEVGVNYLLYVNDEVYQDGLKVTHADGKNIVIHGDKGLFPKYDYNLDKTVYSSKAYFDEYSSVFKAILEQEDKNAIPSIGVYFSLKSKDSSIKVNIPTFGEKDIIHIPNIPNNIDITFEDIKSIDENTHKLIDKYKSKFSKSLEEKFINKNTNGFETILNICAYVLGMKDSKELEDNALMFSGTSGVHIDMQIVKIDGKNYFDYRKLVHNIISYKMADVDEKQLAYSIYESLAIFIKNTVLEINSELKAQTIILCGDMFANHILLSNVKESLKELNIILPSEYPLDY